MSWDYDDEEVVQSNGTYLNPKEIVNHLLLIWSLKYLEKGEAPTKFNADADCIVVDVVDLDQTDPENGMPGLLASGQRWYQARLIRDLRPRVGKQSPCLAMMTTEPSSMGNPAFVLLMAHTLPEAVSKANAWRDLNPTFQPGKPRATWKLEPTEPELEIDKIPGLSPQAAQMAKLQASQQSAVERLRQMQQQNASQKPPF